MSHVSKLLVVAALFALAAPASAQPTVGEVTVRGVALRAGAEVRSKVVSYADLNLTTQEGALSLIGRVRAAARDVCTPQPHPTNLSDAADYDRCMRQAMDSGLAQAHSAIVDADYARTY